jgi:hypothetical protein
MKFPFVYATRPIDDWVSVERVDEAIRRILQRGTAAMLEAHEVVNIAKELHAALEAVSLAGLGWDGDIRPHEGGPYILGLVDAGQAKIVRAYAWKQDRGGMTFCASPIPLPQVETKAIFTELEAAADEGLDP